MSSMLDALGAGGAPPMGGGAPPPEMAPPEEAAPTSESGSDILRRIKTDLQAYIDSPDSDEQETLQATKALATVQGLLASEEKGQEALAGTTPVHKAMAKAIQGSIGG